MKKIIVLLVFTLMLLSMVLPLVGCEEPDTQECIHADDNNDAMCDLCGVLMNVDCPHYDYNNDGYCDRCGEHLYTPWEPKYHWDEKMLIFQLTENDNGSELSSGSHRYLAGDDPNYTKAIDTSIDNRNVRANIATHTEIMYLYWDNSADYILGKSVARIEEISSSRSAKNVPDVYINFTYDMVGATVKGCFANLKGKTRGEGSLEGRNYFEFNDEDYDASVDDRGYIIDWMESFSLSQDKAYILGSDYFIDIIRSAYVIPINVKMLEEYGEPITGDVNEDGKFTIDDFYGRVYAGEWTYDALMDYANAVKMDDGNNSTAQCWLGDERIGFAISSNNLAPSGLLYSAPITLVEKTVHHENNDWDYYYSSDDPTLGSFGTALKDLVSAPGVAYVKNTMSGDYSISQWGKSNAKAIRTRFSTGNILFGDITLIGALEYEEYQSLKSASGIGVVVVPLFDKNISHGKEVPYLTGIHHTAHVGAIATNTTKFVECTAYLNYQSAHSTNILNEYYNYELWFNVMGGADSSSWMLRYIRKTIGVSADMAIEDATGFLDGRKSIDVKVLSILKDHDLACDDLRGDYISVNDRKQGYLLELDEWFEQAKD